MAIPVTVHLPDDVYQRAREFAHLLGKDVADVLAETIVLSLAPIGTQSEMMPPVASLEDGEVLRLSESKLQPQQDERLSELLDRQQEGLLTTPEQSELLGLMQVYQEGLLRKAQALQEAVKRGLWARGKEHDLDCAIATGQYDALIGCCDVEEDLSTNYKSVLADLLEVKYGHCDEN
jgi:hypothetical protein